MQRDSRPAEYTGRLTAFVCVCATLFASVAPGQQTYVTRYDVFAGYSYFRSPKISLTERGFHFQIGVRPTTWYSLGFDYSNVSGDLTLTPDLLTTSLQDRLRSQLTLLAAAGRLPAGYALSVPVDSRTQTFTAGPQLAYRRWKPVTLFVRPSCGLIREVAEAKPADPITRAVAAGFAPEGKLKDWTPFFGAGWGADLNLSGNFAIRVQADYVWDHLFPDFIREGRPTLRFSVGPAINFGKNIAGR